MRDIVVCVERYKDKRYRSTHPSSNLPRTRPSLR